MVNWGEIKEGMTFHDMSDFLATNPGPKETLELIAQEFTDCPYVGLVLRTLYHSGIDVGERQRPETGEGAIRRVPPKVESAKILRALALYLCLMHREQVKSILQLSAMQPPAPIVITKEALDDPRLGWVRELPQVKEAMGKAEQKTE